MTTPAQLLRVLALAAAPLLAALPAPAAAHTRAELEQMLAPVALYPDSVLSHVLIAATYPEEVEEAARWSRRHPDLHGEEAVNAVDNRDWDPSVKALVAFPEVLARMDEDPDWTEDLGDAFLEHEAEVMDSVQTLRDHAYDAGHLRSSNHVRVIREREYIYVEPAVHHVVYVPYYDPWYVYGSWRWPSHPPYRWRHWHGHAASYYGTGFYWGVGFRIAPTFYFTSFYWPERYVVVTHHRHANYRPLYSGRHVTRQPEVRHWRAERPAGADQRQPRNERRRDDRGPAAASWPDDRPGRGPETRRPRPEDRTRADDRPREDRDDSRGNRVWRSSPGESRRDEAGPDRPGRRQERETRRDETPQRGRHEEREGARATPHERPRERRPDREERRAEPVRPSPQADEAPRTTGAGRAEERRADPPPNGRGERHERGGNGDDAPARGRGRDEGQEPRKREERKQRDADRSQRDR